MEPVVQEQLRYPDVRNCTLRSKQTSWANDDGGAKNIFKIRLTHKDMN